MGVMSKPKITKQHVRQVYKLALLGATNAELADFFNVTEARLTVWLEDCHPFSQARKLGQLDADARVAKSLYKRACGYEFNEDKAFSYMGDVEVVRIRRHMPADVNAAKFWLKNRQRDKWKEQPEMTQSTLHEPWTISYTDEDSE